MYRYPDVTQLIPCYNRGTTLYPGAKGEGLAKLVTVSQLPN